MQLERSTVKIGLERTVKLLHITDSHLTLVDGRDDGRKRALGNRLGGWDKEENLREQIAYGEEMCDLIVHTGDLIDFVSKANVEYAKKVLKNEKILFTAGNHDFSQYVGESWEDKAYKMKSYMQMDGGLGVPMFFATEIMRRPWRCTSCESTSQHPMCADTVTSGLCSASTSMHLGENEATDAARFIARRLVQNTCPMVRAMLR